MIATIFPDSFAQTKRELEYEDIPALAAFIKAEGTHARKGDCRYIKLATFGNQATDKACLRNNTNVLAVHGVEGDYDAELMPPEEALYKLQQAGVLGLVYPSWSHTPEKPRWRVLVPLSAPVEPHERLGYAEAVHGLLGEVLAPESAVLSQRYFFGRPTDTPIEPLLNLAGVYLDKLDRWEIWRKPWPGKKGTVPVGSGHQEDDEFSTGRGNQPAAKLECTAANMDIVRQIMEGAKCSPDVDRDEWKRDVWSIMSLDDGAPGGWVEFARQLSMESDRYTEDGFENVAGSYAPDGGSGFERIAKRARANGYTGPEPWRVVHLLAPEQAVESSGGMARVEPTALPKHIELPDELRGDLATAWTFAALHRGELLWVHELDSWLSFSRRSGWTLARPEAPILAGQAVVKMLRATATKAIAALDGQEEVGAGPKRLLKLADHASKRRGMEDMIALAKAEPGMTVRATELDADPDMLGVLNGVVDLRRFKAATFTPEQRITKRCNVPMLPGAECPNWQRFLQDVIPDKEVRLFLRRFFGYSLLGRVDHELFLFLYGTGANGKSLFIETLAWIMGDYALRIPTELLMQQQRSSQGPSADIVDLMGRRLIFANETEEGQRLAEARVKDLTGGDTLTGRVPHARSAITFAPSHSLVIIGNHKPIIRDDSHGMWRRVALVEFGVTIPEAQRRPKGDMLATFRHEGAGILRWLLTGLREYRQEGLVLPKAVRAATQGYQEAEDMLRDWLDGRFVLDQTTRETKETVYHDYRTWCDLNGHKPMSATTLTRRLAGRGVVLDAGRRHYLGMRRGIAKAA